jgi:hypothetical protein
MKFFIVAESKDLQTFSFSVNAISEKHASNKAFKYLTKTLDIMPKRITTVRDSSFNMLKDYVKAYPFPKIKIK